MKRKLRIKKERGIFLAILFSSVIVTGIVAYAISYLSNKRQNQFKKITPNIQIEENNDDHPQDMSETPRKIVFTLSEGVYTAEKQVTIHNESGKDDEFVRVKLVPSWVTEDSGATYVCANIEGISDFAKQSLNEQRNKLIVTNFYDEPILTYVLHRNWEDDWTFDETDQCFYHIGILPSGEASMLIDSVEISTDIYQQTVDGQYYLCIDVLADAIQQYGDAKTNRQWAE